MHWLFDYVFAICICAYEFIDIFFEFFDCFFTAIFDPSGYDDHGSIELGGLLALDFPAAVDLLFLYVNCSFQIILFEKGAARWQIIAIQLWINVK